MSQLGNLKTELTVDPRGRGLAGMTHEEANADLHLENIEHTVESITGQQLFEAVDSTDLAGLSSDDKVVLMGIVGMGTILVNGTNTKVTLLAMFGAGTQTRTNLGKLQTEMVSWANLHFRGLRAGDVQRARA